MPESPDKPAKPKKLMLPTNKAAMAKRKRLFLAAYFANGGNSTKAAIAAGHSVKTAPQAGWKLVDRYADDIAKKGDALAIKYELTVERTLQEIARLAYSDPRQLFKADGSMVPIHELPPDVAATIASLEVDEPIDVDAEGNLVTSPGRSRTKKLKIWDKNAALEKAMKFHGLYEKDNVQKQTANFNLNLAGVKPSAD